MGRVSAVVLTCVLTSALGACATNPTPADSPDFARHFANEALELAHAQSDSQRVSRIFDMMDYRLEEMERLSQLGSYEYVRALAASYRKLCVDGLARIEQRSPDLQGEIREHVLSHQERLSALDVSGDYDACTNAVIH